MPAVLDAPEVLDAEEYDLAETQPRISSDRAGFWYTVAQYLRRQRVRWFHLTSSSRLPVHTFEAPADLLARQYPTLFILACSGV
jgi:hypothetical protein